MRERARMQMEPFVRNRRKSRPYSRNRPCPWPIFGRSTRDRGTAPHGSSRRQPPRPGILPDRRVPVLTAAGRPRLRAIPGPRRHRRADNPPCPIPAWRSGRTLRGSSAIASEDRSRRWSDGAGAQDHACSEQQAGGAPGGSIPHCPTEAAPRRQPNALKNGGFPRTLRRWLMQLGQAFRSFLAGRQRPPVSQEGHPGSAQRTNSFMSEDATTTSPTLAGCACVQNCARQGEPVGHDLRHFGSQVPLDRCGHTGSAQPCCGKGVAGEHSMCQRYRLPRDRGSAVLLYLHRQGSRHWAICVVDPVIH